MSASSKEYVYELNETEFPFLDGVKEARHTEGKGRRVGGGAGASAQAAKHRGGKNQSINPDIVTKTVHDPNHVLGKRRKAHLLSECADGMAPNVPYSMNRKNRWNEIAAASLLANNSAAGQPNVDVAVVERVYTAKTDNVTAVHSLDEDGSIQTIRARGRGTSLASLTTKSEKKKRGSRARREAIQEALAKEEDPEDVEEKEEKAHLHYNLYAPHPNAKVLAGKSAGRDTKKACKVRNVRQKMVDLSELEASELENSIHLEEETYKPSRDFKFCLGDFITENDQPATGAVIVRRQSIESVQHSEAADPEEAARPFDLLDISAVKSLASNTKLQITWLDVEHRRAAVDATRLLLKEGVSYAKPILVVVFEKVAAKNHVRVLINSSIAPTGPFSWKTLKDLMRNANVDSLESVLQVAVRIVSEWKDADDVLSASEDPSTTPNPRFATHRDLFLPNVNGSHLAKVGQALTEAKMAELLREAGRYEADGEEFERIDDSDFDSAEDEKGFADLKPARAIVKCHSCQSTVWDELFELDDSWQCRCCLRQEVINRIRARQLPISLSFVVADGSSSFDVLPAIVPLPLLSFYTKLAATDMLETSDVEIGDLSECPGCKQLVHVDRPNGILNFIFSEK
ncbi:hypothetical protein WR25_20515 isoform L [Diploscapter pachys]|uniref:Uncharacterized protein n=1 Tax=Diploscapter pachys TaxID=2018661 RepID=A0A2A2LT25_9BILA|nr:hypothetical protein WR25_20515 isoform E [Diploscapter pachys]PAV89103.1 hypothetical protein WR25_20515 isoform G [Diploscapter pachys]PAV89104.1 hypothetical protein WR25_20515 isoform H [Diploscapter pachys]PAV89105.1 hypothetical protein WR25_20515 isoform I [Diploscapter pachys]PAV89107.1 hypothetical protein WR25_20515 isoform K [Diploscapter pachys]